LTASNDEGRRLNDEIADSLAKQGRKPVGHSKRDFGHFAMTD
jgi:hypothetical protein